MLTSVAATLISSPLPKRSTSRWLPALWVLLTWMHLAVVLPVSAQEEASVGLFDQGNELYREGRYTEAVAQFEQAMEMGYVSGPLYYNLGNAHFRLDHLGMAIRYYEKALLLMPENEELLHNLAIARSNVADQFTQLPLPGWIQWWRGFVARTGGWILLILGLIFYFMVAGLFIHYIRFKPRNAWLRRVRTMSALIAMILLVLAFAASIESEKNRRAVVIAESAELYENPDNASTAVITVSEGVLIDIEEEGEGWSLIRLPNGTSGWVMKEYLADI